MVVPFWPFIPAALDFDSRHSVVRRYNSLILRMAAPPPMRIPVGVNAFRYYTG